MIGRTILFIGDCYLERAAPITKCFSTTQQQAEFMADISSNRNNNNNNNNKDNNENNGSAAGKHSLSSSDRQSDGSGAHQPSVLRRTLYGLPDLKIKKLFL
ncbi:hypothetical protein TKK_0005397 [Trichogramma kaykai]